jgi:hypothetical protein
MIEQNDVNDLQLTRCQVDVAFPTGLKTGSQPHCPWYGDFNARPQIIEVLDTGWETYHFPSITEARRFADHTRKMVEDGVFAGGRLPPDTSVRIQLRATLDLREDYVVRPA